MNEAEWLASGAPGRMLEHLRAAGSPRKRRLFGCGCCRRIWGLLSDERSREAVRVAELFADGEASAEQLDAARRDAALAYRAVRQSVRDGDTFGAGRAGRPAGQKPAPRAGYRYMAFGTGACLCTTGADPYASPEGPDEPPVRDWQDAAEAALGAGAKWHGELGAICGLLRDVFGNPFRPAAVRPGWLTPGAVALAKRMYESRDFSALPTLADALRDAGCDSADVLNHCRDASAPHVRGCWVVDLVLGKG
jgi:hypothetical protein